MAQFKLVEPHGMCNYGMILPSPSNTRLALLNRLRIQRLFKQYGALLFRGFDVGLPEFDDMTSRYCDSFVPNYSSTRQAMSVDGRTQTVDLGQSAFALHSELARVPWRPDIAWFACLSAPEPGEETVICDGIEVVRAMPPDLRELLSHRSLSHKTETPKEVCETWVGFSDPTEASLRRIKSDGPFVFSIENGRYFGTYTVPVLHKPNFSKENAFANFLLFARFTKKFRDFPTFEDGSEISDEICSAIKKITDELQVDVCWQDGDLLMLDNSRFMHGRHSVKDPARRVIATQFGYASFLTPKRNPADEPWLEDTLPA